MVTKSRRDYSPCTGVSAWFGYGQFSLKCGCGGSSSKSPPPPPARSPPPVRSPPPSPPPPPPPASLPRSGCELYDAQGARSTQITGPIIGGQTTNYGTATLTVDSPPGYLSIVLALNSNAALTKRDSVRYHFYTTESAFATSISVPGCTRYPPGKLAGSQDCGSTPTATNTILVQLSDLVPSTCSSINTIYVVVHLPLVSLSVHGVVLRHAASDQRLLVPGVPYCSTFLDAHGPTGTDLMCRTLADHGHRIPRVEHGNKVSN